MISFGKVAYDAYCRATGGKSAVSGEPLPAWDEVSDRTRNAWETAATAVIDAAGAPVPAHLKPVE